MGSIFPAHNTFISIKSSQNLLYQKDIMILKNQIQW